MLVQVETLTDYVTAIFAAAGCAPDEARLVAAGLVDANLAGHDSHGVARVARYVEWLESGEVEAGREVTVETESGSLLVVDGHYGFGATVGRAAVELGIRTAKARGSAIVALRHAGHLGRIGQWAEMALGAGLVSIHFVNVAGSKLVAPFGGVDKCLSTAPIAFGFPVPDEPPIVLDFATSAVAEGKVLVASNGGKPLPAGSLIEPDGRLSTDPTTLYGPLTPDGGRDHRNGQGAIRAMGEHKGAGLALMCELLCGALIGSGTSGPAEQRFANGMVSIYLDPALFGSAERIGAETRAFVDFVRSSRADKPGGAILLPGDPERTTGTARRQDGIPLPVGTWDSIGATAHRLGVAEPAIAG